MINLIIAHVKLYFMIISKLYRFSTDRQVYENRYFIYSRAIYLFRI